MCDVFRRAVHSETHCKLPKDRVFRSLSGPLTLPERYAELVRLLAKRAFASLQYHAYLGDWGPLLGILAQLLNL